MVVVVIVREEVVRPTVIEVRPGGGVREAGQDGEQGGGWGVGVGKRTASRKQQYCVGLEQKKYCGA